MTELLLICAIGALGVAFATTVGRWLRTRPAGDADLLEVANLVSAGVSGFLRRQQMVAVSVAGVVGAVVFLSFGVAYQTEAFSFVSPREYGVWTTLSYLIGAGLGVAAAWVAVWASRHASARVAAGARRSLDESLQIAIRAGAVSGVVALALGSIGMAGLFLAFFLYAGGAGDSAAALAQAPRIPELLSGFLLGAAFVALLAQLAGGIYAKVADLGADIAGKREASLPEDAARNPAALADLVGDNVGDGAGRVVGVFASAAAEALAAMLAAAMVYRENPALPSVTALVLYPLVARTFGLLATWFGVMVVRTDDTEVPMNALARGLFVTTLLYAVGAMGSAKWLLGAVWLPFGGCAVLGAVASLLLLLVAQYYSEQRHRPVREVAEAARSGPTLATLRGMVTGLEGTTVVVLLVSATAIGAFYLGESSGLASGGLLGVAIAVGGLLGSAPYVLAMDGLGSIVDTAGGVIEMTVAAERPDVRARARLLDAVGSTAKSYCRSVAASASALACFVLVAVFQTQVWGPDEAAPGSVDATSPLLYLGAVLGLVVVMLFYWATLRRIVSAARDLVNELQVQLGAAADPAAGLGRATALFQGASLADASLSSLGNAGGEEDRLDRLSADELERAEPEDPDHASPDHRRVPSPRQPSPRSTVRLGLDSPAAPGQLACVEIVARIALRGMLAPVLVGVGLPVAIGVALRLSAQGDNVSSSAEALVALLFVATIAGALGSLLFTNAGSAWDNAKKYIETGAHGGRYVLDTGSAAAGPSGSDAGASAGTPSSPPAGEGGPGARPTEIDNPTYVAAVIGDTIGDPLKGALGPSTQALLETLIALALVFLPFFL